MGQEGPKRKLLDDTRMRYDPSLLDRLDISEIASLGLLFKQLVARSQTSQGIDRCAFLLYYNIPGVLGEQLFCYFKNQGPRGNAGDSVTVTVSITFNEFLHAHARLCRASSEETHKVLFKLFDLCNDDYIDGAELVSIISSIPRIGYYLLPWEDVETDGDVIEDLTDAQLQFRRGEIRPKLKNTLAHSRGQNYLGGLALGPECEARSVQRVGQPLSEAYPPVLGSRQDIKQVFDELDGDALHCVNVDHRDVRLCPYRKPIHFRSSMVLQPTKGELIVARVLRQFCSSPNGNRLSKSDFKAWMEVSPGLIEFFKSILALRLWSIKCLDPSRWQSQSYRAFQETHRGTFLRWERWEQMNRNFYETMGDGMVSFLHCPGCKARFLTCSICNAGAALTVRYHKTSASCVVLCLECHSIIGKCWHCQQGFSNTMTFVEGHSGDLFVRRNKKLRSSDPYRYHLVGSKALVRYCNSELGDVTLLKGSCLVPIKTCVPPPNEKMFKVTTPDGYADPERWKLIAKGLVTFYGFALYEPVSGLQKEYYCKTIDEYRTWFKCLKQAIGDRSFTDYYVKGNKIGRGKFSTVYAGERREDRQQVAIKVLESALTDDDQCAWRFLRNEIRIMSVLDHPNITSVLDVFWGVKQKVIIMDRGKCDLFSSIVELFKEYDERRNRGIIRQILEALRYLHAMGIAHRDLKCENILVYANADGEVDFEDRESVKIADFGLSWICGTRKMTQPCGTLDYSAPEILRKEEYTTKADMWSLGVLLFVLSHGRFPFPVTRILRDGNFALYDLSTTLIKPEMSRLGDDLMRKLLHVNPNYRLSATQALKHPWFKENTDLSPGIHMNKGDAVGKDSLEIMNLIPEGYSRYDSAAFFKDRPRLRSDPSGSGSGSALND